MKKDAVEPGFDPQDPGYLKYLQERQRLKDSWKALPQSVRDLIKKGDRLMEPEIEAERELQAAQRAAEKR